MSVQVLVCDFADFNIYFKSDLEKCCVCLCGGISVDHHSERDKISSGCAEDAPGMFGFRENTQQTKSIKLTHRNKKTYLN